MKKGEYAVPFVKWAGGKTQSIPAIMEHFPRARVRTYYEPFLGGGALALYYGTRTMSCERFVLNDVSPDLSLVWGLLSPRHRQTNQLIAEVKRVQRHVVAALKVESKPGHGDPLGGGAAYQRVRAQYNLMRLGFGDFKLPDRVKLAARFLFLNRNGFNGLWRVNQKGDYNVPWGNRWALVDIDNLARVAKVLKDRKAIVTSVDFEQASASAREGDVVYFDPPYHATFSRYTKDDFSFRDHQRLAAHALTLANRGVTVLVSQGENEEVAALWRTPEMCKYFIERGVRTRGSIGATGERRDTFAERLYRTRARHVEPR